MDAYVLGTHEGDLPTHLLGQGEEGHRIRAMARLDGPDHNVFYAIEAPDSESVDAHVSTISSVGSHIAWWMIRCVAENCLGTIEIKPFIILNPSRMPPFEFVVFLTLEAEDVRAEVAAVKELLGAEGIAAATDGKGRFLIELGSNDQAKLNAATAIFDGPSGHAVAAGGIQRG